MANDDIYGNKAVFERAAQNIDLFALPQEARIKAIKERNLPDRKVGKYFCRNKENMPAFQKLFKHCENLDLSYPRRLRLMHSLKLILNSTSKSLTEIETKDQRDAINDICAKARETLNPASFSYFITDIKYLWKMLYPVKDDRGRIDEKQTPYVVRHLSNKIDKSKQVMRGDRLSVDEYLKLLAACSDDVRLQAFVAIAYESLGRPQEILSRKVGDVHLYDAYAQIDISSHGKEGIGILRVVDSYQYLVKLLETHPFKDDPKAFLFLNIGNTNQYDCMRPENVNKMLRKRCQAIGIKKAITAYSLKRNGVTDLRLRGTSDKEVQSRARWTTTKQLHTYDIASQEESFKQ